MTGVYQEPKYRDFILIMCSGKEEERNWVLRAACTWLVGMVTLITAGRKRAPLFTRYVAQPPPPVCSISRRSPSDQQGWELPAPQPHAAGSPQIKHGILQSSSSHPQNYNISCSPLKRSCMSNHLNECYIIYKFCCY